LFAVFDPALGYPCSLHTAINHKLNEIEPMDVLGCRPIEAVWAMLRKPTKRKRQNHSAQRTGVQISVWPSRGSRIKARMRRSPALSIDIRAR
jgi:hypothetical protein